MEDKIDIIKLISTKPNIWNKAKANMTNVDFSIKNIDLSNLDLSNVHFIEDNELAEYYSKEAKDEYTTLTDITRFHKGLNFRNISLQNINFTNTNLLCADFSGSNLENVNFTNSDLTGANFSNAKLNKTNLEKANLTKANLTNVDLSNKRLASVNFTETRFDNTNFNNTHLSRTIFGLTNLNKCLNLDNVTVHSKCIIDIETIRNSGKVSPKFLNKLGLSEQVIYYANDLINESIIKMSPVFLSHSWEDKKFAKRLYESLSDSSIHCWFDEINTNPGDKIISAIEKGINLYDKMIFICSKNSLKSWWVERELERILEKERKYNNNKKEVDRVSLLIPITLDDYVFEEWDSPWKTEVCRYIIGDFKNWKNKKEYEKSLAKILNALNIAKSELIPPSYLPEIDKNKKHR